MPNGLQSEPKGSKSEVQAASSLQPPASSLHQGSSGRGRSPDIRRPPVGEQRRDADSTSPCCRSLHASKRLRLECPLPPAPVKIDLKINRKSPLKKTSTFIKNEATLGPNGVLKSLQNQQKLQQMPPRTPPKKKSEKQLEKESFPIPPGPDK